MRYTEVEPKLKPVPVTDLRKGEVRFVSEFARVSKPFLRHRVTVALSEEGANRARTPPVHADRYVVAASSEEAVAYVRKELKLREGLYDLDVITLED